MVEIKDIQDPETLKTWLDQVVAEKGEDEGRRVAVFVAHRVAMRTLPLYWRWVQTSEHARKRDVSPLLVLWAALVSGVVGRMLTPEKGDAAAYIAAAVFANGAAFADDVAAYAITDAINTNVDANAHADLAFAAVGLAVSAASAANANAAVGHAVATAAADPANAADIWAEIRRDSVSALASKVDAPPLWSVDNPFSAVWDEVKSTTMSAPEGHAHWSFWRRWYEDALKGGPLRNPELLKAIALIDPEDWDKGAGFINGVKIPELQADFRARKIIQETPHALSVRLSPQKRLVGDPASHENLASIIAKIRTAVNDFLRRCRNDKSANKLGQDMLRVLDPSVKDLRRDLKRYQADASSLFDAIKLVRQEISQIASGERFSDANGLPRLLGALETAESDICIAVPAVLEQEKSRTQVRVARYSDEQKLMALRLAAGFASDSDGLLQAAARVAIATILDETASAEELRHAWYFVIAMVPRGAREMHNGDAVASPKNRVREVLDDAASVGDKLAKVDKGVDAVQETLPEAVDWVTEFYTQISSGSFFGYGG